jgi:prephenate dehydrogenase
MSSAHPLLLMGFGRFGESLAELATESGIRVRAFDPERAVPEPWCATSESDLLQEDGLVMLAVPISRFEAILASIRPWLGAGHTVVDVCSVKSDARASMEEICGSSVPWVSTHPLFGPTSIAMGEHPLRVVVCPDTPHQEALGGVRDFYRRLGCTLFEQSSEEHDRTMADTHALAFFVAKGMLDLGIGDEKIVPPSFRAMAGTIDSVRSDAGHLFFPIQHANPFAAGSRERLLEALSRIHRELAEARLRPDLMRPDAGSRSLAIPPLTSTPQELGEARASIDALDVELIELLARRTQLSLRAARAKLREGRDVQDPRREEELLERRSELASSLDLDPGAVMDVFEAILRFSRAEQRRWLEEHEQ